MYLLNYFPRIIKFKLILFTFCLLTTFSFAQVIMQGMPEVRNGQWLTRFNQPGSQQLFSVITLPDAFTVNVNKYEADTLEAYVFVHLKLNKPITEVSFDYNIRGSAVKMPITLFDAGANVLWQHDGKGNTPHHIVLQNIKARGQLVFKIARLKGEELQQGWSQAITTIKYTDDKSKPVLAADGFTVIDNLAELRGFAVEDNVKVRLKPGNYTIDKAIFKYFIEFSGNNSQYDLTGARFKVDTRLFRSFGVAHGGEALIYCVMALSGDHLTMTGPYIETYGNLAGIQSRNKIFNIIGPSITLQNAEVLTQGSSPWGYGSLYGISGGDVRKMNGIRIGWPAKNVKVIGCKVHMRAMGHGIFVQGADNTLIEDCHVDGLLRSTNDILAQTSGYAFERHFIAQGKNYIEGVTVGPNGQILPDEMVSLSEDGIRMYPQTSAGQKTGATTIRNCTVNNMRRGICTALNDAADKVINCQVTNCVATSFNVGANDTLINCKGDAKYGEALTLAQVNAKNAKVDLEILDSRGGTANNLLAKINGSEHDVLIKTSNNDFIPKDMVIELATKRGYGGPANPTAKNIKLANQTLTPVLLLPGNADAKIESKGEVKTVAVK